MMGSLGLPIHLPQLRSRLTVLAISPAPDQLRTLLRDARVGGSVLRPEALLTNSAPVERQLVLLDTVQMAPVQLARVLVRLSQHIPARLTRRAPRVAVLVDAADRVASTLLACAPFRAMSVRPKELAGCVADLARLLPSKRCFPTPPQGLPTAFLEVFVALDGAETMDDVATACDRSRAAVQRTLAATKIALGLPDGRLVRFHPDTLLAEIVAALGQSGPRACGGSNAALMEPAAPPRPFAEDSSRGSVTQLKLPLLDY